MLSHSCFPVFATVRFGALNSALVQNLRMLLTKKNTQSTTSFSLKFKARSWCALLALITVFSFITLVSTAATHYHTGTQEIHDCSICSVVSDKIGGSISVPTVLITSFFVLFALTVISLRSIFHRSPALLPPSCGPPLR